MSYTEPVKQASEGLKQAVVRGARLTLVATVIAKLAAVLAQVVTAWFISPYHFGLVGTCYAITGFLIVLTGAGLREVLVQERVTAEPELSNCFWLALALHVIAALTVLSLSPLFAHILQLPQLTGLLCIAAASWPLAGLGLVAQARLQLELRFTAMAATLLISSILQSTATVIFAIAGLNAVGLMLSGATGLVVTALVSLSLAPRTSIGSINPRRWPALLRPTGWLVVNHLLTTSFTLGVCIILSLVASPEITGAYYWSLTVASQAVTLFATNTKPIVFAALASLQSDPHRQANGFRDSCTVGVVMAAHLCIIQMYCARPAISWLLGEKWQAAIVPVYWLSASMILFPLYHYGSALLSAAGHYRRVAFSSFLIALGTTACAAVLGRLGASQASEGVALTFAVGSLMTGELALRSIRGGAKSLIATLAPLALPCGLGVASAHVISALTQRWHPLAQIGCIVLTVIAVIPSILRITARPAFVLVWTAIARGNNKRGLEHSAA